MVLTSKSASKKIGKGRPKKILKKSQPKNESKSDDGKRSPNVGAYCPIEEAEDTSGPCESFVK